MLGIRLLAAVVALVGLTWTPPSITAQTINGMQEEGLPGPALQQGGFVIYFRHALEEGQDQNPLDLDDCGTQQRLTEAGREQARAIGSTFRELRIPVGPVLSSPICRAYDTAAIAFGSAERIDFLSLPATLDPTVREGQVDRLRALLGTPPDPGMNTVLVSHSNLLMMAAGTGVDRAEAAIFAPDGIGGFTLRGLVAWDAWHTLFTGD